MSEVTSSIVYGDVFKELRNLVSMIEKRVYDTKEAAVYLGMSEEWLKKIRRTGSINGDPIPIFRKVGRSVKYLKEDLDSYLDSLDKYEFIAQGD